MRALILNDFNGPLELTDLPRPTPTEGQVLIHVQACGLNPLDTKIRGGAAPHAKHPIVTRDRLIQPLPADRFAKMDQC
jgi:NADPH2:quinone reductase